MEDRLKSVPPMNMLKPPTPDECGS
uniref:Uncharacterized protein n=1 Tax=Arundo donax TaxID=35708 RepID=A0A0A8YGQ8_ARUDO